MYAPRTRDLTGFTLIEVMVALAIISIALLAALRAAGLGTSNVDALRERLLASWVAENLIAEHQARGDWPAFGVTRGAAHQGGRDFAWREEVIPTPNAAFRRVDVFVYGSGDGSASLARLTGVIASSPGMRR